MANAASFSTSTFRPRSNAKESLRAALRVEPPLDEGDSERQTGPPMLERRDDRMRPCLMAMFGIPDLLPQQSSGKHAGELPVSRVAVVYSGLQYCWRSPDLINF